MTYYDVKFLLIVSFIQFNRRKFTEIVDSYFVVTIVHVKAVKNKKKKNLFHAPPQKKTLNIFINSPYTHYLIALSPWL